MVIRGVVPGRRSGLPAVKPTVVVHRVLHPFVPAHGVGCRLHRIVTPWQDLGRAVVQTARCAPSVGPGSLVYSLTTEVVLCCSLQSIMLCTVFHYHVMMSGGGGFGTDMISDIRCHIMMIPHMIPAASSCTY